MSEPTPTGIRHKGDALLTTGIEYALFLQRQKIEGSRALEPTLVYPAGSDIRISLEQLYKNTSRRLAEICSVDPTGELASLGLYICRSCGPGNSREHGSASLAGFCRDHPAS